MIEKAKNAAALPCYSDDEKALERSSTSEMRAAGLTLAPDARAMLLPLSGVIGRPRAASSPSSRSMRGGRRIGGRDVTAVVSDASGFALDDIVDAAFAGRPAVLRPSSPRRASPAPRSARSCSRPASGRSIAQMEDGHRRRRFVVVQFTDAAAEFSPSRAYRGRAPAVERGAIVDRNDRACRRRPAVAARRGSRSDDCRTRAAGDRR